VNLLQRVRGLLRNTYRELARDHVTLGSTVLPARHLRFCGDQFKSDEYFLASANAEAQRLVQECGLPKGGRVLDLGCGVGRLPIGILASGVDVGAYRGVDVDSRSIRWCKQHIESFHPRFHFIHTNVRNARYNPNGLPVNVSFHLPFGDHDFDAIYLYSVFSHMLPDDVRVYCREFRRVLAPEGVVFLTAFVEDDVPDVTENPVDYKMKGNGVLHCVRYKSLFLTELFAQAELGVAKFVHGMETDGQSALYLR